VPTYRLRVWLPDRPGALGLVASRIGAVGGDIVAVDILGRAEGRAVDEFVLHLPGEGLLDLLVSEVHEVDGVAIDELREVEGAPSGD
jgi:UTP:GlnB (protein PII) uridylyltransferase